MDKEIPMYNRVINGSDNGLYSREVNEIKNLVQANPKNQSICVTSFSKNGDNTSAYLYIFDTPPIAIVRISNHEAIEDNIKIRTKKAVKSIIKVINTESRWTIFQSIYEIARKIK